MTTPREYRKYMKSDLWLEFRGLPTDQQRRLPNPPIQKPYPADKPLIDLVQPEDFQVGTLSVREAIARRTSRRAYSQTALSLEELSYLAWATQGFHEIWRMAASPFAEPCPLLVQGTHLRPTWS